MVVQIHVGIQLLLNALILELYTVLGLPYEHICHIVPQQE